MRGGGVAPLRNGVINANKSRFLFAECTGIRKPQAHPLHPPPRSAPALRAKKDDEDIFFFNYYASEYISASGEYHRGTSIKLEVSPARVKLRTLTQLGLYISCQHYSEHNSESKESRIIPEYDSDKNLPIPGFCLRGRE